MANFYCKNCGQKYSSVKDLTMNTCQKHPDGPVKGKHELYEGSEKDKYTCKYCGQQYRSIRDMVINSCQKHPDGPVKGKHSPAL